MAEYAPVALFVYKRPEHTRRTLDALRDNKLAQDTDLFVYSDGPKDSEDEHQVTAVRKILSSVDGFRSVSIVKQEQNIGLANSVIGGVSKTVGDFGKIIVLEDDLVTSPAFLTYMNRALSHYEKSGEVWHVSGWSFPLSTPAKSDAFLWRHMVCWGWGTWADRWQHYEKDADRLVTTFTRQQIRRFNLNGSEKLWSQVLDNKSGKIDSWAIFWYATIFRQNGLCLNPSKSFVEDIGKDGSGTHVGVIGRQIPNEDFNLATDGRIAFPEKIEEASWALREYTRYQKSLRGTRISRLFRKLRGAGTRGS